MYLNPFKEGHALPRRQRRILPPVKFRRLSVGNAAAFPPALRPVVHWIGGDDSVECSAGFPISLPRMLPAVAGKLTGSLPPFAGFSSEKLATKFRRLSAAVTETVAGRQPITFQSNAQP